MNNILIAFLLTLLAGLSTGIGSIITVLSKNTSEGFLTFTMGFSGGVMIYISLTEIFSKSVSAFEVTVSPGGASALSSLAFFAGAALIALISKFIPSFEGERAYRSFQKGGGSAKMLKTGIISAFAIALHNFPEGMATFVSAFRDPAVALPVVVAVALHNIPEGIAVAAPVLRATGSRKTAFTVSFLSGLAEPVGAIFCWILLMPVMTDLCFGIIFAAAAGIMVYISVAEVLPSAFEGEIRGLCIGGIFLGMLMMALSLILFK